MIQHAFKSAYTNQVSAQNKTISNVTQGIKDLATVGIGALGFAGALGDGVIAEGAEHALAGRIGGVGGNIMLASLKEKKATAKAKETRKDLFSSEDVANTVESTLGSNPINRSAKKSLSTVFEKLTQAKREGLINKKGNIETDFGDIDPNSEMGKRIMDALNDKKSETKTSNVKKGYTRLYRGLEEEYDPNYKGKRDNPQYYESWTNNPELARKYGKNVYYIDVKNEDIAKSVIDENPNSETYGDRNYIYKNTGKGVDLDGTPGDEYLLYTEHDKHKNTKYNKVGGEKK